MKYLNTTMLHDTAHEVLSPIVESPPAAAPKQSVVSGLRGSAMVSTAENSLLNVSASPVELFSAVELAGFGQRTGVHVFPNHCEQRCTSNGQVDEPSHLLGAESTVDWNTD